ncbi:aminoglycoside 6'-N-acetyltransferase [Sphingomonas bisphenolicum]|uniref:Aminoglycoside N(6')-acetyltransferase type 1 n=1 Tax=Sphingomonas bisphenolicum TaxID=296544 RepID=A0ABM7G5Y6_9SPHN|nr:aminoglycoside 6'-N-acetyltransferase [Sphingomonas bisphenolicum]BBF70093.1 aminoglycoside N(6')-acetyltransferase type 1 [Sphingomonas bisphenolicum]
MSGQAAQIIRAAAGHAPFWARMRAALWPDASVADHHDDIADMMANGGDLVAFVALDDRGDAIAFVEASLRRDYVNGCDTSPVVFVEGLYVTPAVRHEGIAKALIDAVAIWGQAMGCTEMASDADIGNLASHAFHRAACFVETERVVYFRKALD